MTDEPALTRWKFEDFKQIYDAKFGRKRETGRGKTHFHRADNCTQAEVAGNGNSKSTAGLAIYEQFVPQENNGTKEFARVPSERSTEKLQKCLLPAFESVEMRTLAESISRDILRGSPDVQWQSIKGLENAKRLLKEAVVMPIKYPNCSVSAMSFKACQSNDSNLACGMEEEDSD